ncbi:MAG: MmgE/PrpD family protein [Pseudomonadota bacterium]
MALIRQIARHIVQIDWSQIPVEVVEKAKSLVLDAIGCGLYGQEFEAPGILLQLAREWNGRPESSIIGTGVKMPSATAAKINGVAVHVADFDDSSVEFRGHPTSVVLPAVLALCESNGKSGRDLLLAYIVGVEIGGKLGRVMGWSHYEAGWHGTSTIGTIASAIASSKALNLNEEKICHALAIAASGACGIRENFGTMVKSLHAGQASAAGVTAALLAERGYEGSLTAFEGQSGFWRVYSGESAIGGWADGLNELNTVMGVMFKRYPSCAGTHPALDALEELMKEQPFSWEEVEEIKCLVPPVLPSILIYPRPNSGLEAKFSLPYCLSAFLVHGKLDLAHFGKEAVDDSRVRKLMEKVQMISDENQGNLMKATGALAPTEVHVKLKKRTMSKKMLEAKGGKSFPLERGEIEGKFRVCAGRILPAEKVDRAIDLISSLETLESIATLTETLNP